MKKKKKISEKRGIEDSVHIKLEYNEALESKRDVLSTEMDLLKIVKIIKKYKILRLKELNLKLKAYRRMGEIRANIGRLQKIIPKIKIPEFLKQDIEEEVEVKKEIKKKVLYGDDLEAQLREIQDKLASIER